MRNSVSLNCIILNITLLIRLFPGEKVIEALKRKDEGITHAAMDLLCTLMQPMHDNYDLGQEQLNKKSLLSSKSFVEKLLDEFQHHVNLQVMFI